MKNFLISLVTISLSFFITGFILNSYDTGGKSTHTGGIYDSENTYSEETNEGLNNSSDENNDLSGDFSNTLADFDTWKDYNKENIHLATDFIGVDLEGNEITKKEFLEKLKTGKYVPRKLYDAEFMYQLHRINNEESPKISKAIKDYSSVTYNYFLKEGKNFPDFDASDIYGNSFSKTNCLGKTLVVECWFIQSGKCIEELPKANSLYDRYESHENIVFLSFAFDKTDRLKSFLAKKEYRYPVIPDQKDFIKNEIGATKYPTHLIVNEYGEIVKTTNNIDDLMLALDTIENGSISTLENEM